jgi:hypothetical protein
MVEIETVINHEAVAVIETVLEAIKNLLRNPEGDN